MAKKRSSQRFETEDSQLSQNESGETNDLLNENSDGDDVEKFNEHVKSFDTKFSSSAKAAKIEPANFTGSGGTFQEIEVFNFMCHEHLKVDLRDNINFIVGNNGSGKSAILTALTVCLGARASSTQRATSLESLIKEGASEARVVVKISNSGALRFKGEFYGDSIIVERRFRRNGPNSFKTKSGTNGRIVSDRKDEVIAICDNYNIQVDNPLSILTQETAKKFLVNSTPQDLYEFFMRATQLEQLSFDYAYALDRMKSIQTSLNTAKKSWPALEEKIEYLKIELQTINEQKMMAQKINELKAEIIWTNVAEREKDAQLKETQILSEQEKIIINNENGSVLSKTLEETNAEIKAIDKEITLLYNSKIPLKNELHKTEESAKTIKENLKTSEEVSKTINSTVTRLKEELNEIEKTLQDHMNHDDTEQTEKNYQIEQFQQQIQAKNREFTELSERRSIKLNETEELESKRDAAEKVLSEETRHVNELTRELENVKFSLHDKIKMYGEKIPEVLDQIRARSREFRHQPIGPIGMHVELLNMNWSRPMDAIIGNHLKSFITHDHKDRVLLESIIKSFKCNNPVINLSLDPIDTRDGEPDPKFLTALRVLRINNVHVKKALIMFSSIERILLIEDRVEVLEVMRARLRNVDSAYTKTHRVTCTQNSLASFAIYSNVKGNPFESSEERVKHISRQLEVKKHSLNVIKRDSQSILDEIQNNRELEENFVDQIKNIKKEITFLKNEIRTTENSLATRDETGIDVLKSEKEAALSRLASLKSQFMENFDSQLVLKDKLDAINEKVEKFNEFIKNIDSQVQEKHSFINRFSEDKRKIQAKIELIQSSNSQLNNNLSTFTSTLKIIREEVSVLTAKAMSICERIQTKRSINIIEKEIHSLEMLIEKGKEFGEEDYQKAKSEYEETSADYEKSKINVRINENILDDMKIALERRQRQWEDLRNGIAKRSNQDFAACLQARDYRGYLDYDHKKRELNINVHIDQIEQISEKSKFEHTENLDLSKRDIKQLSGGEKSFGTTCFLLSLWDAMGCPIRCLDEFDVYMDAVNRRLVVEMLINNARNSGTQFILITPVSVRSFLDTEDQNSVHMIVLRDPQKTG